MGFYNGSSNFGTIGSSQARYLLLSTTAYGGTVGSKPSTSTTNASDKNVGVTTDPTKSGMVATFSGITLGTIASLQLGKFCIKY